MQKSKFYIISHTTFGLDPRLWKRVTTFSEGRQLNALPKAYLQDLQAQLFTNFKAQAIANNRFPFHAEAKRAARATPDENIETLKSAISKAKSRLRQIDSKWRYMAGKCQLQDDKKHLYTKYNFYSFIEDKAHFETTLTTLANTPDLADLISGLAVCSASSASDRMGALKQVTPEVKTQVRDSFISVITTTLHSKLSHRLPLEVDMAELNLQAIAKTLVDTNKHNKQDAAEAAFYDKAKKAGITKDKTQTLWQLITQRRTAIKAYRNHIRAGNDEYALVENIGVKTPAEIGIEFQNAVTALLSIEEFSSMLGDKLQPKAIEAANNQLALILKEHKLDDTQQQAVLGSIKDYYYNKYAYSYYYKRNKKKLNQKLSVLLFYFEKDYKTLMAGYGIDIDNAKKNKSGKYEW